MGKSSFRTHLAMIPPWNEGPPQINAPLTWGIGVRSQTFIPIPTLGQRPLSYHIEGLPQGLKLDPRQGVITGSVSSELEVEPLLTVSNVHGQDSKSIILKAGAGLALTPPMGWNSWNCWGAKIDAGKVRRSADALITSGLAAHGYNYVNIDDGWQGDRGGPFHALQGNSKFPDMAALCSHVHSKGLRIGIYSTPWSRSYAGYLGGSEGECIEDLESIEPYRLQKRRYLCAHSFAQEDARQWAVWGIDYLKYDWAHWKAETVEEMHNALCRSGRDIVYSLSNSAPFEQASVWARLANLWRTTGDIRDDWQVLSRIAFNQDKWIPYAGPGHWNDPDMLVVGKLGWGSPRENRLTPDEQITHMTMWALLAAPLLIGCDLEQLDELTIRLLCNDEVLAIDQDPLGQQAHCVRELKRHAADGRIFSHQMVYARTLYDGSLAVGFFNRGPQPERIKVSWAELGLHGRKRVRDIWAQRDIGYHEKEITMNVPAHGAQFVRIYNRV
ncbi:MAG: glycoside hydrolase family 27 protein [Anaerolineae bacterium]|nr:glycoside hydrolase family 27 protein [Anaerolineae bacterium]